MGSELITIGQASKMLGVSIQTLRRWDDAGKLFSIRKTTTGYRYYRKEDIENYNVKDLFKLAKNWIASDSGFEPRQSFYCLDSSVFQARLSRLENELGKMKELSAIFPLITAITGEIGNNSFDHNLGRWPDIPGIFFGYDIGKRRVVLADRGLGVLATLKRVRPELKNHLEALRVAFTEIVSGRAPEARGNGLKFVRQVVAENPISLFFRSGDAELRLKKDNDQLFITRSHINTHGCFAVIEF